MLQRSTCVIFQILVSQPWINCYFILIMNNFWTICHVSRVPRLWWRQIVVITHIGCDIHTQAGQLFSRFMWTVLLGKFPVSLDIWENCQNAFSPCLVRICNNAKLRQRRSKYVFSKMTYLNSFVHVWNNDAISFGNNYVRCVFTSQESTESNLYLSHAKLCS